MSDPNMDPNARYDGARCRVCAHPVEEQPRTWGCGHCCPAVAPEVPSRDPGKFWLVGVFYPAGNASEVRAAKVVSPLVAQFGEAAVKAVAANHTNGKHH